MNILKGEDQRKRKTRRNIRWSNKRARDLRQITAKTDSKQNNKRVVNLIIKLGIR